MSQAGKKSYARWFVVLGGAFLLVLLASLLLGRYALSPGHLMHMLWTKVTGGPADWSVSDNQVVFAIRLPRVAAALVGAALSVSGAAYQGMFRNPMVSPDILGASTGAGKSTLFRCLLGFLPKYAGQIELFGQDLKSLDRKKISQYIAYIPQESAPVYNYAVRDTVLMGADPFHAPGPKQQETTDRVLSLLGIREPSERGINEISGGERQLALIARAMAQEAKILLMDEPTASLDYGNQFRLLSQVKALAESGFTVLLSTHNPEYAFRFATHALVLQDGCIRAWGPVGETLTEALLGELYRIPLKVAEVPLPGGSVKSCVYGPPGS